MSDRIRELVDYDPLTGSFTRKSGRKTGNPNGSGYLQLNVDNKHYYAHRLAWWFVHGYWPKDELDHINGNRSDNRIANLREASRRQNSSNMKGHRKGLKGAFRFKKGPKWTAQICHEGVKHHLGVFENEHSAHEAYCEAAKRLKSEYARFD